MLRQTRRAATTTWGSTTGRATWCMRRRRAGRSRSSTTSCTSPTSPTSSRSLRARRPRARDPCRQWEPMDELEFDRELQALLDGRLPRSASLAQPPSSLPPAVVALRAGNISEPLVGHRARFQMTSFGEHGEWLDYGWRDGLRIVSEPTAVDGLAEPGVWVQEEADYYRTLAGMAELPRFAAGISRVWVEEYVSQEALGQPGSGN